MMREARAAGSRLNNADSRHGGDSMKALHLCLAVVIAAATSGGLAYAEGETIAVFTKNQTNPFFQNVRVGAESAAKQLGAKVIQYVPTKPDSIPDNSARSKT